ncbi:MAG: hypothetical protein ACRC5Q_02490 [Culicoidibacterales bacterium]
MGKNEQLNELTEERMGILSLLNTVAFSKWMLAIIATMSLSMMIIAFIRSDVFFSSYAGIGMVFFSFAGLLDAALIRIRLWLVEIDEEITELKQKQQQIEEGLEIK